METTADESIVPRPNSEIDDALGTSKETIASRPGPSDPDFPTIIGDGIAACMRERAAHQAVEQRITEWFSRLPANKDERLKMISASRAQMETARLAIEAFYLRFRGLASTAKN